MKPAPFHLHSPATVDEALDVLADVGEDGKVLAGGQSLLPLLNMRLAAPAHLVDLNGVADLAAVEVAAHGVRVGALARQAQVARHAGAATAVPLLAQALSLVAHPVVRNRGTVVGSLVHADPAGELTAVLTLLGGSVQLRSQGARRSVAATDFFLGPLESCLRPDELAVSADFPALPPRSGTAFREVARRHGDYAVCGVAAVVVLDAEDRVERAAVSYVSMSPTPERVELTDAVVGQPGSRADWAAAARMADEQVDPEADLHASAAYRRRLGLVLTGQALAAAATAAAA